MSLTSLVMGLSKWLKYVSINQVFLKIWWENKQETIPVSWTGDAISCCWSVGTEPLSPTVFEIFGSKASVLCKSSLRMHHITEPVPLCKIWVHTLISHPTLPIHYDTFIRLWWRMRGVYSWDPNVKRKITLSKNIDVAQSIFWGGGGGKTLLPENYVWKINKIPEFSVIFVRKFFQNARIFTTFVRKINKIPKFCMIFSRKVPEFYMKIARKIFSRFSFFWGGGSTSPRLYPPSPTSMQRCYMSMQAIWRLLRLVIYSANMPMTLTSSCQPPTFSLELLRLRA